MTVRRGGGRKSQAWGTPLLVHQHEMVTRAIAPSRGCTVDRRGSTAWRCGSTGAWTLPSRAATHSTVASVGRSFAETDRVRRACQSVVLKNQKKRDIFRRAERGFSSDRRMGTCLSKGKGKKADPKKPETNADPAKATAATKGTESAAGDKMICESQRRARHSFLFLFFLFFSCFPRFQ